MVVDDQDGVRFQKVPYSRRFQDLAEQNVSAGINDNSQVSAGRKIANYPVPATDVAQIFGDINRAIQRYGLVQITQHLLQCQARTQAVAVRVFGLDDDDVIGGLDELLGGIKHSLIIADGGFDGATGLFIAHIFDRVAAGVADKRYQARQHSSSDDTKGDRADDHPVNRPEMESCR